MSDATPPPPPAPLRVAVVCASNMNRSVEAHAALQRAGYAVRSFGTSTSCKLPGPAADRPNVFAFGTPYAAIYDALAAQSIDLYTQNGVLAMLERNMGVKERPERWQERATEGCREFDVVVTYEARVFEAVCDDLSAREQRAVAEARCSGEACVHVFNLPVRDTHEDAAAGARATLELLGTLSVAWPDWERAIDPAIVSFVARTGLSVIHAVYCCCT